MALAASVPPSAALPPLPRYPPRHHHALHAAGALSERYDIGQGSFAVVLEVTDRVTGERLCAKQLPKSTRSRLACQQSALVAAEAAAQRALCAASGSILRLHDLRQDDAHFYLVSELCQCDLAAHLAGRGPLPEREAAHITRGLLAALNTCHRHGVAYRDVKPANLLVRRTDADGLPEVCLADFGCSHSTLAARRGGQPTAGTPLFSAPECVHGCGGAESDVWAAGVLLYFLLSGEFPFCDPHAGIARAEYWRRLAEAPVGYSGAAWAGVSPGAVALLRRMLDRDCSARITAQEALADEWLAGMTSSGAAAGAWRAAAAAAPRQFQGNVVPGPPASLPAATA